MTECLTKAQMCLQFSDLSTSVNRVDLSCGFLFNETEFYSFCSFRLETYSYLHQSDNKFSF